MRDGQIIDMIPLCREPDGTTVYSTARDAALMRLAEAIPAICGCVVPIINVFGIMALYMIGVEFCAMHIRRF